MSSAADPVVSSDAPAAADAAVAQPAENDSKSKKAAASKASKAKKPSGAKKARSSPTHPPFLQVWMIDLCFDCLWLFWLSFYVVFWSNFEIVSLDD